MYSVDLLPQSTFMHAHKGTFNPGTGTHVRKLIMS